MSGHSRWSSIKHKKKLMDARKGKIFTKLIREITVAARLGGGDPDKNPRLRAAIAAAKAENMPKENIERSIKRGIGEIEGVNYEEVSYEGYGPGGVAVLVDCLTDNKNRTVAELKHIFEKYGGSLGEPGCVAWVFEKKGIISIEADKVDEDKLLEIALEAGAEDVKNAGSQFEVITDPADFEKVKKAIEDAGIPYNLAEITMIPKTTVKLDGKKAEQMLSLMQALEDLDDVSHVYANFDIPDEIMEAMAK
ncbi:MAG: YebC/PmpR family DNA-binding transcriptional regulator [Deltaproteobacteria bacterium]|nr:MAG: YebC/PmpR family DNA-binding transcriptional regulator [Deltaproteobacteria bacterium]